MVLISSALCFALDSSASAFFTWRTKDSSASACALITVTWRIRSASETSRTSLIRSSSCATVFSTATRSRITFEIFLRSSSNAFSFSIRCSSTSRSRATISNSRARLTRSCSIATALVRFCCATSTSRIRFSSRISISC